MNRGTNRKCDTERRQKMKYDLVDYLLGALDVAEQQEVEDYQLVN